MAPMMSEDSEEHYLFCVCCRELVAFKDGYWIRLLGTIRFCCWECMPLIASSRTRNLLAAPRKNE